MNPAGLPERPVVFPCGQERLVGILHPGAGSTGVVIVVGGPQYRAGSHRHFVQLARAVAAAGWPVLRFDARGMGDSSGALHTFEQITPDIGASIEALMLEQPQVRRVVLWGLCDAASAALLYLGERTDTRVAGLCLANPWVRSEQSLAKARVQHYYLKRLREKDFWLKLLRGKVGLGAATGLARNVARAGTAPAAAGSFVDRMRSAWAGFAGPILLLLSEDDLTAREFADRLASDAGWRAAIGSSRTTRHDLSGADHTFSRAATGQMAIDATLTWLQALAHGPAATAPTRPSSEALPS